MFPIPRKERQMKVRCNSKGGSEYKAGKMFPSHHFSLFHSLFLSLLSTLLFIISINIFRAFDSIPYKKQLNSIYYTKGNRGNEWWKNVMKYYEPESTKHVRNGQDDKIYPPRNFMYCLYGGSFQFWRFNFCFYQFYVTQPFLGQWKWI